VTTDHRSGLCLSPEVTSPTILLLLPLPYIDFLVEGGVLIDKAERSSVLIILFFATDYRHNREGKITTGHKKREKTFTRVKCRNRVGIFRQENLDGSAIIRYIAGSEP